MMYTKEKKYVIHDNTQKASHLDVKQKPSIAILPIKHNKYHI